MTSDVVCYLAIVFSDLNPHLTQLVSQLQTRRLCLEDLGLSPFLNKLFGRGVRGIFAVNENDISVS